MKHNNLWKIWNIIYPILLYFVVSNVVIYLSLLALNIAGGEYASRYMMLQTISAAASLPVLYGFYRQDKMYFTIFHQRTANAFSEITRSRKIENGILMFTGGALAGVVLNNLIAMTGLAQRSEGYQSVTAQFFAGGVFFEILGAGILVPMAEELLYRGIVYARLTDWIGIRNAAIVSSVVFGALHFNLVQFIYALILGILLAWFFEKSNHLYGAISGHIGANLLTILRVETNIFAWMEKNAVVYWGSTIVMLVLCIIIFARIHGKAVGKNIR